MNFNEKLHQSSSRYRNIACVGFDPLIEKIDNPAEYFFDIIEMMKSRALVPAAFKPNIGYFTSFSSFEKPGKGLEILNSVIAALQTSFPEVPIILDSKRGDIARSSANYADEAFRVHRADAVTVSPYMGSDSLQPFAQYEGEGLCAYVLNRTSNKGGADVQNLSLSDNSAVYEAVSRLIIRCNHERTAKGGYFGAVVGATNLKEMADICAIFKNEAVPMLIPGVGSQGASASDVRQVLTGSGIDERLVRINSSSKICFPYTVTVENGEKRKPRDYMQQIEHSLKEFLAECRI